MSSRRSRVLVRSLACLLAGGLLVAAWSGYRAQHRPSTAERLRELPAVEAPHVPKDGACVSFVAVGDTGWANQTNRDVLDAMVKQARIDPIQFVLMLGDNFYLSGVTSVRDPQWATHITQAFTAPELAVPLRPLLGNHDHNGNIQAQVEYAKIDPRWQMEGQYYAFSKDVSPGCAVEFFMLDTNPIRAGDGVAESQIRWLEDKLANSTATWKILAGHHPIVSGGVHGGSSRIWDAIEPLIEKYGVDLYMSGHDHDLQLLRVPHSSCLQLVSGAGSSTRETSWTDASLYAESSPGFAWICVTAGDLSIEFVTAAAGPRFVHHIRKPVN